MNENSKLKKVDSIVAVLYMLITVTGLFTLMFYSKSNGLAALFKQGLIFAPISIIALVVFVKRGNIDIFRKNENIHYIISTILLIAVLLIGKEILGAKRSLNLLVFTFQPSYYTRIILISSLAIYISKYQELLEKNDILSFLKKSFKFVFFFLLSLFLILKEPHLSIVIITISAMFVLLVLANLHYKSMLTALLIGFVAFTAIISFGHNYRGDRINVFFKYSIFNPFRHSVEVSPDKERQIVESLGALSAGGLWGTDSDFGSAVRNFVPEADTDYIYSFIGEEYGFVAASLILLLFFGLFFRLFILSSKVKDSYKRFFAMGLSLNFIFTVIVNVGVATSLFPSTGVSLPFISYGGSAFLMDSISLSIILNILAREGLAR